MALREGGAGLVLALAAACGGGDPPSELVRLARAVPAGAGWSVVEGPVAHGPATLYEYLDGGADLYLRYGFREHAHLRYQLGADPSRGVTVDLFDMGSALGAFGIYAAVRPPGAEVRLWGAQGYRDGSVAAAWKGSVYVHAEADGGDPESVATLEGLVRGLSARIPGADAPPSVLDPLPVAGRVAQSERWVPDHLLGHSFLPGGVLATYEFDGRRSELYLCDLGGAAAAREGLQALEAHLARWGRVEDGPAAFGDAAFRFSDPSLGEGTAVAAGRHLAGIHGELDRERREAVLGALFAELQ